MFSKELQDVNILDINNLIDSTRLSENERIEYKSTLPSKGSEIDPWINGQDNIGNTALKKLTNEVIAFANTHGGILILGIEEDGGSPSRPASINALPRCEELEQKLMESISDRIEPRIDGIKFKSIISEGDAGIILIQVPRSSHAPHRSKSDKNFYVRDGDRCRLMEMYEIKALSIKRSRQKIEALWSVVFRMQNRPEANGGVVVFEEGKIYGGDSQFYYHGIYEVLGETRITGYLSVTHYFGPTDTAFDTNETQMSLILEGELIEDTIIGKITHTGTGGNIPFKMNRKTNLI